MEQIIISLRLVLIALGLCSPFIITFEVIDASSKGIWSEHEASSEWCEGSDLDPDLFIREVYNARSDYAYIFVGCLMIALGTNDSLYNCRRRTFHKMADGDGMLHSQISSSNENILNNSSLEPVQVSVTHEPQQKNKISNGIFQFPYISIINGIINVLHGLGSFWNHACQCPNGRAVDTAGMMGVVCFPLFYTPLQILMGYSNSFTSSQVKRLTLRIVSFIPPLGQVLLYIAALLNPNVRRTKNFEIFIYFYFAFFPLLFMYITFWKNKRATAIGSIRHSIKPLITIISFIFFILGYVCWKLDLDKTWCFDRASPFHFLQGHALWHIFTSVTILCLYLFYRVEKLIVIIDDVPDTELAEEERNTRELVQVP